MWRPCLSAFAEGVYMHDLRVERVVGVYTCEVPQPAGRCASWSRPARCCRFIVVCVISVTFWLEVEARRRFPPTHPDVHSRVCSWRAEGHVRAPGQGSQAGPHVECAAVAGALALKPQQANRGGKSLSVGSEAAGQVRPPFPSARCGD